MVYFLLPIDYNTVHIEVHRQNVPRQNVPMDKTSQDIRSQGQNVLRTKCPNGQNVPGTKRPKNKMSQRTKRPTLIIKFSKTNFVLEHWPHILGNGPHPCTQFMIGVFLFWGG